MQLVKTLIVFAFISGCKAKKCDYFEGGWFFYIPTVIVNVTTIWLVSMFMFHV